MPISSEQLQEYLKKNKLVVHDKTKKHGEGETDSPQDLDLSSLPQAAISRIYSQARSIAQLMTLGHQEPSFHSGYNSEHDTNHNNDGREQVIVYWVITASSTVGEE